MKCEQCDSEDTHVIDSRRHRGVGVRRRRECGNCGHRMTTHEIPVARMRGLELDGARWRRMKNFLAGIGDASDA